MSRLRIARAEQLVGGHSEDTCSITMAGYCDDKDQRWRKDVKGYRSERKEVFNGGMKELTIVSDHS